MKTGNVVAGLLAGVAVGAVLGVLFAPDKGSNTRKQLLSKGKDCADSVKDKINQFADMVTKKAGEAAESAEQMASKGKEKYNEAKGDMKTAIA